MKNKILNGFTLAAVLMLSACGGSGGGGSSSSSSTPVPTEPSALKCPTTIGNDYADYKAINSYDDLKHYLLDTSSDSYDKEGSSKYCLTSDITIGSDFTTIDKFSGTLNGQGKAINNLKRTFIREFSGNLNRVTFNHPVISSSLSTGFYNYIAIITKNTGIIDKIKVNNPEITGEDAGGFIGDNNGTVQNTLITGGTITDNSIFGSFIGGAVTTNSKTVGPKVHVTGMTINAITYAGGLVGINFAGGTIKGSQVTATKLSSTFFMGGIVALVNSSTIENNCVSELSFSGGGRPGYVYASLQPGSVVPALSGNQFKPNNKKTNGDPDYWGVGGATAATSGITTRDTTCDDLAIVFN